MNDEALSDEFVLKTFDSEPKAPTHDIQVLGCWYNDGTAGVQVWCNPCEESLLQEDKLAPDRIIEVAREHEKQEAMLPCVHCGSPVRKTEQEDWIHKRGLYRCQSPDVPYGHLAHPEGVPCRADGPNPCLGAEEASSSDR